MKTIIQACSQHMKHKNESRINMKNNHPKHGISKTITQIHMINMIRTCALDLMINMIAKTKENTRYRSILNMGVSRTNHVKHSSNEHGHYLTNHETLSML